jgi:hypothetical protein
MGAPVNRATSSTETIIGTTIGVLGTLGTYAIVRLCTPERCSHRVKSALMAASSLPTFIFGTILGPKNEVGGTMLAGSVLTTYAFTAMRPGNSANRTWCAGLAGFVAYAVGYGLSNYISGNHAVSAGIGHMLGTATSAAVANFGAPDAVQLHNLVVERGQAVLNAQAVGDIDGFLNQANDLVNAHEMRLEHIANAEAEAGAQRPEGDGQIVDAPEGAMPADLEGKQEEGVPHVIPAPEEGEGNPEPEGYVAVPGHED